MILLQVDVEGVLTRSQILSVFLSLLLTVCAFFFRETYVMIKEKFKRFEQLLIDNAGLNERMKAAEDDIEQLRDDFRIQHRRSDA